MTTSRSSRECYSGHNMTLGIDYANMDQATTPDFHAAYAAGVRFVYLRRSYTYYLGHDYHLMHDAVYARDAQAARDAGLVVGAYMFPDFGVGAPSPTDQVANFLAGGGEIKPGIDLPPCLDVEFPGKGIVDTGRQSDVLDTVIAIVNELKRVFGIWPAIYTSHVQMHDDNGLGLSGPTPGLTAKAIAGLAKCPLWIKTPYRLGAHQTLDPVAPRAPHYVNDQLQDPGSYWRVPAPWQNAGWFVQQTQGDVWGIAGVHQADASLFHTLTRQNAGTDPLLNTYKTRLGIHGLTATWDDAFDAAVRAFQKSRGLTADAIIGPATAAAILWLP